MNQTIIHIMKPIKDCILKLKAKTATLADYYICLLKLATTCETNPLVGLQICGSFRIPIS